ncbi:MAG: DUF5050 domain-containing protein [Candidatus Cloacimonetes bacterium]|nr:DUF5050 domain-containing protein [Candidatus Cloacimonadota bacterium]MBL7085908.1 DUF5050 domain-containing protein [Candidatus Cloacimonadota bacterium]
MDDDGCNVTYLIDDCPRNVQFTPDDSKIIINRGQGGIWSINTDGTEEKAIMDSLWVDSALPSFSPDSTIITFAAGDIYTMNIDGTNIQNITNTPDVRDRYPHFSPDGDSIVYTTDSDSETTISIMYKNGENNRKIISTSTEPYPCYYYYPRFNISGDKIYYKYLGEQRGLYSINTDGTDNNYILGGYPELYPISMSDDGSKLVFSTDSHIYILNTDDSGIMDLGVGGGATISSDGSKIVFGCIKIMNSDGSGVTKLEYGWGPRFSNSKYKDHYKIVYGGLRQINKKGSKGIVF